MAARTQKTPSFEDGLNQLESMAQEMETSPLSLEELLSRYEEGMKLAGELTAKLEKMKATLETLHPTGEETSVDSQMTLSEWMEEGEE